MRFSLQTKLISFLALTVSLNLLISLFYFIPQERKIFQRGFEEKAKALAHALDAGIGSFEELKNFPKLQDNIYKFIWLYPDLMKISISTFGPEGLKIVASSKIEEIGSPAKFESRLAFEEGKFFTQTSILPDGTKILNVFNPIHLGGKRAGAYEIVFSLEAEEREILRRQLEIGAMVLLNVFAIILLLSLLIRKVVILPLAEIKKGLGEFSRGNLSWRIKIKSEDEIGDLTRGFNEMAERLEKTYLEMEKKIEERTRELREAKSVLEIKVRARTKELEELARSLEAKVKERTKELQKRLKELEKFHQLTIGRELKVIELKKEIERLKAQLKRK